MAITLDMNPTTVNVITDLVLIVMQLVWLRAMQVLSIADIKRQVRFGRRIFSYETIGSFVYLNFGFAKYRKLKRDDILSAREHRSCILRLMFAMLAILMNLSLILLHVLIDYGLDFTVAMPLSDEVASYDMNGLHPDTSIVGALETYQRMSNNLRAEIEPLCEEAGLEDDQWACDIEGREVLNYYGDKIRESVRFASSVFDTGSIEQLNAVQSLDIDYRPSSDSEREDHSCRIKEFDELETFTGNFEFERSDCSFGKNLIREIRFQMATKISFQEIELRVEPEFLGADAKPNQMRHHLNAKDQRQVPSTVSLKRLGNETLAGGDFGPVTVQLAQLSVDSKLVFGSGQSQTLVLRDLTRYRAGVSDEHGLDMTMHSLSVPVQVITGEADNGCYTTLKDQVVFRMNLRVYGMECGTYEFVRTAEECNRSIVHMDENGQKSFLVGFQATRGAVMLYDSLDESERDECLAGVREMYSEYLDESFPMSNRVIGVAVQAGLICATPFDLDAAKAVCPAGEDHEEGCRFCQIGGKVVKLHEDRWERLHHLERVYDVGSDPRVFKLDVRLIAHSVEVEGGDPVVVRQALENLGPLVRDHFATLLIDFLSSSTSRNNLLGLKMQWFMHVLISMLSTQMSPEARMVNLYESKQVAVLQEAYLGGLLAVLIITGLAVLVTAVKYLYEFGVYYKLNSSIRIPVSVTEWVVLGLKQISALKGNSSTFYNYDFTVLPVENLQSAPSIEEGKMRFGANRRYKELGTICFSDELTPVSRDVEYRSTL
mmetsp:Transcript_22039/g.31903  ORF Transcript_22039/g.31903 Transcript_22039/m.31903 type:complete len:771 (-) Transcript_22039:2366-4678(-)|eukprot:CAMPEP_0184750772 /NCGR_PEP_ID=MMETSP0315-20130426/38734_1 /TAXON_ID=101924 /ORGANISM="Rhodosorus marinus, Strain UTEX LB 2760" /LENGTH=770 /DNA_ID=CAMNT_0027229343 /DNA_START=485 /DNA_END=2797 /DNA_ORIENTATION=+